MSDSLVSLIKAGEEDDRAHLIDDGIFMSRAIANCYLITTSDGDLLINTGLDFEAPAIKERFSRISSSPLHSIVFTQGHPDHVRGWSQFDTPGVETIVQANHHEVRSYWHGLHPFYARRIAKLWERFTGEIDMAYQPPEPVPTVTFIDRHEIRLGGQQIEFLSTPGGEATDALVVSLPERRTVFIGNLMGPMFGHLPNLYTVRGDKIRSASEFIRSVQRVIDLRPEVLVNGHDVFRGTDEILTTLTKVRDATLYLRERVFEGMNAGSDLWTLMSNITLPDQLMLPELHGKVPWAVRAIWEEYVGWFRYESTTELYDIPPSSVWTDLVDLAGVDALVERARGYLDHDQPLQALHLTDIVLSGDPSRHEAMTVRRDCLEALLERSGRENFSEVQWLESELFTTNAKLA